MNMTTSGIHNLTLDRPVKYQIIVPGIVDEKWFLDYPLDELRSTTDQEGNSQTMVTTTVDQAALQGLLSYLYTLRLPLMSVRWISCSSDAQQGDR